MGEKGYMNYKSFGIRLTIITVIFSLSIGAFYPALADSCFHSVFGYVYINDSFAPEGTEVKLVFYEEPEEILDLTDSFSYYQIDFLNHDWEEGFFFVNYEGEWFVPIGNISVEIVPDDIGYRVDLHINTLGSPPYKPDNPNPVNNSENVSLKPINLYGQTKAECEKLSRKFALKNNFNLGILRFSNVYGSYNDHFDRVIPNFIIKALMGEDFIIQGGNQLFDFTHIDLFY